MWGKAKKNRKNDRDSLLEVKMRSRDARRWRIRFVAAVVGVVGGTMIGALLMWHGYRWALQKFVYTNNAYAIRRIELRHDGRLHPDQLRRWSGVNPGDNLLALDLARIRADLEQNPWVERADVEARRPDCLRLSIWEREPVAQVVVWRYSPLNTSVWAETNYVDAKGFVLPPLRAQWLRPGEQTDFSTLPRLTGIDPNEIIPGRPLRPPGVRPALQVIAAYQNSSMYTQVDLNEVNVTNPEALEGLLSEGTKVVFGPENLERQMRRWRSIHEHARQVGRSWEWIDLSVTNHVPARFAASTNAPVTPRPTKTAKPSRRHV